MNRNFKCIKTAIFVVRSKFALLILEYIHPSILPSIHPSIHPSIRSLVRSKKRDFLFLFVNIKSRGKILDEKCENFILILALLSDVTIYISSLIHSQSRFSGYMVFFL